MHPAYSVIFFTTASGAGYGLLALTGLFGAAGLIPEGRVFGALVIGLALALITAGLLSSTLHLGHPERAWRAFSQWRSSWLSREGVAAVATYVPALLFAIGWVLAGQTGGWVAVAGVIAAICAAATVYATAMIYASLKPIAQWKSPFTVPAYLTLGLASGAVLLNAGVLLAGGFSFGLALLALAAILAGWYVKLSAWRHNDGLSPSASRAAALGLPEGDVRNMERAHTSKNFVEKEMIHRIGRKHAAKLRMFVHALAFAAPALLTVLALIASGGVAAFFALLAVIVMAPGLLIERWLFFAEAEHAVSAYYEDRPAA